MTLPKQGGAPLKVLYAQGKLRPDGLDWNGFYFHEHTCVWHFSSLFFTAYATQRTFYSLSVIAPVTLSIDRWGEYLHSPILSLLVSYPILLSRKARCGYPCASHPDASSWLDNLDWAVIIHKAYGTHATFHGHFYLPRVMILCQDQMHSPNRRFTFVSFWPTLCGSYAGILPNSPHV